MIQIKRNNKVFFTLEDFGEGSKLSYQLMDHHYIILKFSTATPVYFEIGDSVEIPDFGYFELTSAYFPKHNESDGYDYEMQMDAYYMSWKNKLCKYRPQNGANETSFKLTTTVGVHMNVILGNLKARGLTYNGKDFSVDYTTYNNNAFDVQKRFLIEYGSISILDALNAICSEDALNCEWWIDGSIIYLGYCEMEGQTTFEQGVNVLSMSYSESKSTYITRLYAFGSDRNIPKGYFTGADADVTTDGAATDYLMLPNKEVDSDGFYAKDGYLENVNVVKNDKQAIEGVVMFEDEYPKVKSAVSSIKTYDSTVDNEDGTKTTQTFWQVTSTDSFTNSFKESWIKSNLTLGIKFTSGALMGMEFDVNLKVIDKVNYFEIVANDTYGRTLPDGVMCPKVGNNFFLFNWDATKITDTDLIPAAQLSLFDRAKQYYQKTMISNSNFTCTMDGDKFYNGGTYDYHTLGEQVKLIHEMFPQMDSDGNHYRNSRIIGMDIKLDIPYDKPEYVVGEKAATSRLGKLEEKVDSITVNGLKIDGSAGVGGSVYVIGVNDITPETDSNVYSARRTKKNLADIDKKFLRKDQKDVAQELITFLKGIKTAGIENDGNNITHGVTELYDAIMSNGFKNSMTAGSGWQIDKNGNAQVESIKVRSYMCVLELVMNRLSAEESEFIFTEGGTVETATPNEDGTYTLVMRKKTDKDITPFQEGDILKGVVNNLAEQGTVGVNYYTSWMQVKKVNQTTNSIKVAVYPDNEVPSGTNFPPCELMVLHRWGNADETKKERQSCWYISSIEKRIVMLNGVTQPKLEESNYASFYGLRFDMESFKGYSLNPEQPYLYVRGALLQDVCFIDYLGKVVKQERYRGIWSQDVANSKDPYIVTQTTFDTVYHNNAKWQCNSTEGTNEEPSVGTTDWTMLTDGGEAITVDSTDVYYCIFSSGEYAPNDNYDGWTQIVPTPTEEKPYLWTRTRWYFSDGTITPTYTVVRNGKNGANAPRVLYINSDTRPATPTSKNPSGWGSIPLQPVAVSNMRAEKTSRADYSFGKVENAVHKEYWASLNKGIYNSIAEALIYFDADNDGTVRFDWYATCGSANKASIYKVNSQVDTVVWNIDGYKTGVYDATVKKGTNFIRVCYEKGEKNTDEDRLFIRVLETSTSRRIWVVTEILTSDGEYAGWSDPVQWTGNDGRNLTKVTNYYKWGASGDTAPSEPYAPDTIPTHVEGLDYLWNYEVCSDDNEDTISQSGKTCIGYFPKDGEPGKGIASITEYYQIGTERKPAAISVSTDGTTVTISSGWEKTMGTTTVDNRFVWNQEVIEYSDGTYSVTAVHLAGAQGDQGVKGDKGDQGDKGDDGNGMEYIYMRTEGSKAPNAPSTNGSTPTGWTKEPSGVNAEYPYEWVSMRIQDKGVWGNYSKPTLWKDYSAMNANLLEQTDFDGLLTKWESRSRYQGTSYEDDSINHISNDGKDGVNCYYDISSRMKYESLYKDVLIQRLVDGSVTRLKPSTWYTLSFYAKCGVNVKPVNLTSNEYGFGVRVVYLEKGKRYKFSISGRIDSQAKNDGKSLRCYVYNGDWSWVKALIIDTTTDTTKSIEFSDVPSEGTYQFRAYMFENGGSRAGKVTLNWANVEEVDGELFSIYIYPSLVDNTKVFVDGEQKAVTSDCEVKYKASSSDWVRHTVTFKTRSTLGSKQNLLFRMLPIVMSDNTHFLKICMPKLEVGKVASAWQLNESDRKGEDGQEGKNGKPLAGPTEWNASVTYMSGKADDEPYQSLVINSKYPKQMYLCGYSHSGKEPLAETSTSSVDTCTEEKPWVQVPYQDFVATKVLFAAKSLIKDLNAETIEMRDSNGNRLFYLHDGQLECNVGTFKNITAIGGTFTDIEVTGNSIFKGKLNGVTGSFRNLNCVGSNGEVAGGIMFDDGRMYFDGDMYSQGYNYAKERGNRFYASDIWCRGNFGHYGKTIAVVYGRNMRVYSKGLYNNGEEDPGLLIGLTEKTAADNKTKYYEIPLYSPGEGNNNNADASGMPIDIVVFNIPTRLGEMCYAFTGLSSGKEWRVINANDKYESLKVADTSGWTTVRGGCNTSYVYISPKFLSPSVDATLIGGGVFHSDIYDMNW